MKMKKKKKKKRNITSIIKDEKYLLRYSFRLYELSKLSVYAILNAFVYFLLL